MSMKAEWDSIHPNDLWVINKLFLATRLGYNCGPAGVDVPTPGEYIVRPSLNLMGMGIGARDEYLEGSTDHLAPADFWCEKFHGEHMSVDYYWGECDLVVVGERQSNNPYHVWDSWYKVDRHLPRHPVLDELHGGYEWVNCEFIDGHLIEVQFHCNSDFLYGNTVAIPVRTGGRFVVDKDYGREGFIIY